MTVATVVVFVVIVGKVRVILVSVRVVLRLVGTSILLVFLTLILLLIAVVLAVSALVVVGVESSFIHSVWSRVDNATNGKAQKGTKDSGASKDEPGEEKSLLFQLEGHG